MFGARLVPLPENRSALAAGQRLLTCLASRQPERVVNPLVLHGPPGTGKTTLVQFLIGEATRHCPDLTVTLLESGACRSSPVEDEESQVGNPIPDSASFSDLLVVEDLQRLPREAFEPLVQVFDQRLGCQIQMIFTASLGPQRLDLPARLTSRLAGGLVVNLGPLSTPSRLALLEEGAQRRQLAVSRDVLAWIAERLGGSGRELEGALTRLQTLARSGRQRLDLDRVAALFHEETNARQPGVERITQRVSGYFHIKPGLLCSSHRGRNVLLPRQVGMYLARRLTGLSLEKIGAFFGGRDHTTVLHACRKIEQGLDRDPVLSGTVRQLQAELG